MRERVKVNGNGISGIEDSLTEAIRQLSGGEALPLEDLRLPDVAPTESIRSVWAKLEFAWEERFPFALVCGPAGTGKTLAARHFAERHGGIYIRCFPEFSPLALLEALASRMGLGRARFRTLIHLVWELLSQQPRPIVLDEAQLLGRPTLETAKWLADETGSLFVLVTMDEFADGVRRGRDIESRIGVIAQTSPASAAEIYELFRGAGWSEEVLAEVHRASGGVMRDVIRLIKLLEKAASLARTEKAAIFPVHVRAAAARLNLAGGRP